MIMCGYSDNVEARKAALRSLKKFKKAEAKAHMYSWKKGSFIASHTKLERLREIIERIGYEWSEGTVVGTNE